MSSVILKEHQEAILRGWVPKDDRPIWQIANNRYGMDRTRRANELWQISRTPWAKQILEDSVRADVQTLVTVAGSQTAKTAIMLIRLAYGMAYKPVPRLWITGNAGLAADAYAERIEPTLKRCPDLVDTLLTDRLHMSISKVKTKLCSLDIAGSKESGALHQNAYSEVYADECGNEQLWDVGQLQRIGKRIRSFVKEGAKAFLFSTPGRKGAEFHQIFIKGTQNEWHWPCRKCNLLQILAWRNLKFNGEKPHLLCEKCGEKHFDTPEVRRHILENGQWVAMNPNPEEGVVSYHWPALLPPWVIWKDLITEWENAMVQLKSGNKEPLKIFINESLGEFWEERVESQEYSTYTQRKSNYKTNEAWPFTKRVFLTADIQAEMIYWSARAWGLGGVSRLLDYGRVFTSDDLRAVQTRLGIKDGDVGIDSGFRSSQVYQWCHKWGWKPLKGCEQEYFTHQLPDGSSVRRPWAVGQADPGMGTSAQGQIFIPLYLFSSDSMADKLSLFMSGSGPDWELPQDTSDEYIAHLAAEKPELDAKGKRVWKQLSKLNHYFDTEKMNLAIATIIGLVASSKPIETVEVLNA